MLFSHTQEDIGSLILLEKNKSEEAAFVCITNFGQSQYPFSTEALLVQEQYRYILTSVRIQLCC